MSKEIEQLNDTDIIWVEGKPKKEETHIIIFNSSDKGYATFASGMALIKGTKLIGHVYSKLLSVGALNAVPEPVSPQMKLYETRNSEGTRFFILKINDSHGTDSHEEAFAWLYTYPTYRDIILSLNGCGVIHSSFFTIPTDSEDILELNYQPDKIQNLAVFDYMDKEKEAYIVLNDEIDNSTYEDDIVLLPSCWIWCDLFSKFSNINHYGVCHAIILGESTKFIDRKGIDDMLQYCSTYLQLEWDEEAIHSTLENLDALDTIRNNISQPTLDRFMDFDEGDFI